MDNSWFDTSAFSNIQEHIDAAMSEAKKTIDAGGFDMLNLDNLAEEQDDNDDDEEDDDDDDEEEEVHHHGDTPNTKAHAHGIHSVNLVEYNSPLRQSPSRVPEKATPAPKAPSRESDDWDWNTPVQKTDQKRSAMKSYSPSLSSPSPPRDINTPSSASGSRDTSASPNNSATVQSLVDGIKMEMARDKDKKAKVEPAGELSYDLSDLKEAFLCVVGVCLDAD